MARNFVYLTATVDVVSRRVQGRQVAITQEACHAMELIEQAFARYGVPEIVNTGHGRQYAAEEFTCVVFAKRCKLSIDGCAAWRYHVRGERLWRSVKYERLSLKVYENLSAAGADMADSIDWYKTHRPHSKIVRLAQEEKHIATLRPLRLAA